MKVIGVVCDNYKIERFKSELAKKGYTDISVTAFTENTSTLKFEAEGSKIPELTMLIKSINSLSRKDIQN